MRMSKRLRTWLTVIVALVLLFLWSSAMSGQQAAAGSKADSPTLAISIGGEPVVILQRPRSIDQSKPQFLEATVLPGRGMAVLQIKAYVPGKG